MQTYLGLDIGTYSIKAVVLKVNFEHFHIEDMLEHEIVYSTDTDEKVSKIQALKSILSAMGQIRFDSIYASLGCQFTVMKKFELNNLKRSHRQKVIESEFDLLGLFDMDDYSIEYHTIQYSAKNAKVLGILIKKASAKKLIDVLEGCDLSVRIIDIDNIAYLNLVDLLPLPEEVGPRGVELIIDFGHTKTTFSIIENHKIINTRIFNMAGHQLTRLIQNKFNISYTEAHDLKHNLNSQIDPGRLAEVGLIIDEFLKELCREFKRTIKSINAVDFLKIERIFLTGGSAKIEGVEAVFEKNLDIKVISMENLKKNLNFKNNNLPNLKQFSQCIAVALRGNLKSTNSRINIRHGSLALVSNYEKIISELTKYAKLVAIFLIVLAGTYFLRYFLFMHRINDIKTQFKKEIVEMFVTEPRELRLISGKKNWDFSEYSLHALKTVQQSIKDKRSFISQMNENSSFVLGILNQISLSIPKNIYFEVVNFKYQDKTIFLEADTINSESVESILTKLKGIKSLNQVVKKSEVAKVGSDGKLVHFSIMANLSDKGDNNGL